jgi:hypothetical protein
MIHKKEKIRMSVAINSTEKLKLSLKLPELKK